MSYFGIVLISLAAAAVQPGPPLSFALKVSAAIPAAADGPGSLPPNCLAAGIVEDAGSLLERTGDILAALGDKTGAASLRAGAGERMGNPTLAGVDLSAPARFFYMDPKTFRHPWVFQFGVADQEALNRALMAHSRDRREAADFFLSVGDGRATWSLDAEAAKGVLQWQQGGGTLPKSRAAGRVRVRVDVQKILGAYNAEFAAQLQEMKARMREALGRKPGTAPPKEETPSVQSQLDAAASAFRQVQDVDLGLDITPAFIRLELDARLPQSSPLSALLRAHRAGDTGLLGLCPPDASVAIVNNLSFVDALRSVFWNALGLSSADRRTPAAGAGHRAIALFLTSAEKPPAAEVPATGPRPAWRVEVLDLRDGAAAGAARQEWDRLSRREGGQPFILRALPAATGAGEKPAASPSTEPAGKAAPAMPNDGELNPAQQPAHGGAAGEAGGQALRLAEIAPDEAVLSPGGIRLFRRFLGNPALAAQEARGDLCITAIGRAPAERVRQVDSLLQTKKDSLLASDSFRRSVESLPDRPNVLLYVSAGALQQWFALAGLPGPEHSPADAMGLAAGAVVGGDGVRCTLKIPLGGILGATPQAPRN